MYKDIDYLENYADTTIPKPLILCEYDHAMGNSVGNLQDYWDAILLHKKLQGGFIWDWCDQTFLKFREDGTQYWGYGGDMGDFNIQNDSNFCANGLVQANRELHPHVWEVKKVYQYMKVIPVDMEKGLYKLINRHDFKDLSDYYLVYEFMADGKILEKGKISSTNIPARSEKLIHITPKPGKIPNNTECFISFKWYTSEESQLIPENFEVAWDQYRLPYHSGSESLSKDSDKSITLLEEDHEISIMAGEMKVRFDKATGMMISLAYSGKEMIKRGLRPNFWRFPTDNDLGNDMPRRCAIWKNAGEEAELDSFSFEQSMDHVFVRSAYFLKESNSIVILEYLVKGSGEIHIDITFVPGNKKLPELPRVGTRLILPAEFQYITWFGRGPHENYSDRNTGAAVGLYSGTVWDQYHPYVRPQETGNKTDIRWMTLKDKDGYGLLIKGDSLLSCSAWQFEAEALEHHKKGKPNRHGTDVKPGDIITLNIDLKQMGVGGDNSWGALPLDKYRIFPDRTYKYGFKLIPFMEK